MQFDQILGSIVKNSYEKAAPFSTSCTVLSEILNKISNLACTYIGCSVADIALYLASSGEVHSFLSQIHCKILSEIHCKILGSKTCTFAFKAKPIARLVNVFTSLHNLMMDKVRKPVIRCLSNNIKGHIDSPLLVTTLKIAVVAGGAYFQTHWAVQIATYSLTYNSLVGLRRDISAWQFQEKRQNQLGNFAVLPNDIIRLIFEKYVPYRHVKSRVDERDPTVVVKEIWPYPCLSKGFKALSDSYFFVKKFFPPALIDAIGMEALRKIPLIDLKTRLINSPPSLNPSEWDKQIKSAVYRSDQIVDPRGASLQGHAVVDQRALYVEDPEKSSAPTIKLIDPAMDGVPLVARKDLEKGCPVNFYVQPEELGERGVAWYLDAAGRPGFLARYRLTYWSAGRKISVQATCGFHQVDPCRNDVWVWHDFTAPAICAKVNNPVIEIQYPRQKNLSHLRWFYIFRTENGKFTKDSKGSLEWFKEFFAGKEVIWLLPGGASAHQNAPYVQISYPDVPYSHRKDSWSDLQSLIFNLLKIVPTTPKI